MSMMLSEIFGMTAQVRVEQLDKEIEDLSRQLDLLRLLKQIVEIQEEGQVIGGHNGHLSQIPIPDELLKQTETVVIEHPVNGYETRPEFVNPKHRRGPYVKKTMPGRTTVAGLIYDKLSKSGPLKVKQIIESLPLIPQNSVRAAIRQWKGRVFEMVSHGIWKAIVIEQPLPENPKEEQELARVPEELRSSMDQQRPEPLEPEEQSDEDPIMGNPFRIKAYLQHSQPSKPAIISADLKIPLSEVVMILQKYKCFTLNGNGYLLAKGTKHAAVSQ